MKKLFLLLITSLVSLQMNYAQWSPTAPTVVCTNGYYHNGQATIISDGEGGYIMAWQDVRAGNLPNDSDLANIYIQRLNADGIPQWTANGLLVCGAIHEQTRPLLALCKTSTNQTRVMVVWRDNREVINPNNQTRTKIYAQAYNLTGTAQWAADGVQVADCDGFSSFIHEVIPSSDGQRVLFSYEKRSNDSVYLQTINPDNGATLYAGNGTLIESGLPNLRFSQAEGSTDINMVWYKYTSEGVSSENIYAQRVAVATGAKQWANPAKVCIATGVQWYPEIQGNIVVWLDERFPGPNKEIFAQRLNADGTVAWAANGINITNDPASQFYPRLASAGTNSVWVTWTDDKLNNQDSSYVSLQKINADGTLAFGNQGLRLTSSVGRSQGMVVSQDDGGALVLYEGLHYQQYRAHKVSATGQKLWGPIGQPVGGLVENSLDAPVNIEGIPLAGGGAIFAVAEYRDIWALRAKICDAPPTPPSVVSPYRRCAPGSYSINLQSSGCPSGSVRYFSAPNGLGFVGGTLVGSNNITVHNKDTTQYVYAECVVNGCASTGALVPAHIQIAETSYTNAQLLATYPKTANDLPTVALSQTTITAQNRVNPPANVLYQATQSVMLNPGFQANQGAVFRAEVKACMNLN
jgi:hypothetical protein